MFELIIDIQNGNTITQKLDSLADFDSRALLEQIGKKLHTSTLQRFNKQVDVQNIPWVSSQRALKDGGKTLIDTGKLLSSIDYLVVDDETLEVGTNVEYAESLQLGQLTFTAAAMHPRSFLGVNQEDEELIKQVVSDYFKVYLDE